MFRVERGMGRGVGEGGVWMFNLPQLLICVRNPTIREVVRNCIRARPNLNPPPPQPFPHPLTHNPTTNSTSNDPIRVLPLSNKLMFSSHYH